MLLKFPAEANYLIQPFIGTNLMFAFIKSVGK